MLSQSTKSHAAQCATIRVKDAVATTGVCKTKLYELIGDGTLKTVKVGRARLILRSSLDPLLTPVPRDRSCLEM